MTGDGPEKNAKNDTDNTLTKLIFSGNGNSSTIKESHNPFQRNEVIYSSTFCINHFKFRLDVNN